LKFRRTSPTERHEGEMGGGGYKTRSLGTGLTPKKKKGKPSVRFDKRGELESGGQVNTGAFLPLMQKVPICGGDCPERSRSPDGNNDGIGGLKSVWSWNGESGGLKINPNPSKDRKLWTDGREFNW